MVSLENFVKSMTPSLSAYRLNDVTAISIHSEFRSKLKMNEAFFLELVSRELNHFGGIASFFQDWALGTLTGGE